MASIIKIIKKSNTLSHKIDPYFSKMLDMLKAIAYVVNTAIKEIKIVLLAYWL